MKCPIIVRQKSNSYGAFFMTKYSSILKVEVVQDYQSGAYGYRALVKKYGITLSVIQRWIYLAQTNGLEFLQVKHSKRTYSLAEKLAVVDYYQTHDEGASKVAARFGINASQVSNWRRIFNEFGAVGLRPKPKGRPVKMTRKQSKKISKSDITPTEKEALQSEISQLKAELYQTQMERDILKKLGAVLENNKRQTKRK